MCFATHISEKIQLCMITELTKAFEIVKLH